MQHLYELEVISFITEKRLEKATRGSGNGLVIINGVSPMVYIRQGS